MQWNICPSAGHVLPFPSHATTYSYSISVTRALAIVNLCMSSIGISLQWILALLLLLFALHCELVRAQCDGCVDDTQTAGISTAIVIVPCRFCCCTIH
jgi:hypothetical protein